jgi:hypothetical protein
LLFTNNHVNKPSDICMSKTVNTYSICFNHQAFICRRSEDA